MTKSMPLGPVLAAVAGTELTPEDRERLMHPLVGGLTLFSRNFVDADQVTRLCSEIHALRAPGLLICVDHEGGRVQRFKEGFTRLPPMRRIGELWDQDSARGTQAAWAAGLVMAVELRQCGVDLSFAPVLDLDFGASTIIGDRAFHSDANAVTELAGALLEGLSAGGMAGVGKHFPGHGFIAADSHLELPIDVRAFTQIEARDLQPFRALSGRLAGVMPAHVLYPQADERPAGYSRFWLQEILRKRCGFDGAILSDDLGMQGAAGAGGLNDRAMAAFEAGCDLVLACTPQDSDSVLAELNFDMPQTARRRLRSLFGPGDARLSASERESSLARARASLAACAA